ncbi:hypothetical protein WKR88_21260 [Trinickia caryophylli]|uniref:Bacteriophage protein n=1 Tax=Trinickia caryophylli TaxID=28094 RepID=A0A1X7DM45_TRICW|nr:hypothetical protein [Trinickia caryophylli]WQE12107.1 hypothetical protein U0034_01370 [Trinickia caryophylli]GLU31765.1 bacteriophage protein [Trinickia caryophylli]SMF18049.1 hypothetical protein SAMN06295900_103401 [Trinickia caryophylli]
MSRIAKDIIELKRLSEGGAGALTQHLLRELAASLIALGVADQRGGC